MTLRQEAIAEVRMMHTQTNKGKRCIPKIVVLKLIAPKIEYFQHAHFIPIIVGVGKRGEYYLVHGDLPRQHPFGTTLRFTGPVPVDSRQLTPSVLNCVTR